MNTSNLPDFGKTMQQQFRMPRSAQRKVRDRVMEYYHTLYGNSSGGIAGAVRSYFIHLFEPPMTITKLATYMIGVLFLSGGVYASVAPEAFNETMTNVAVSMKQVVGLKTDIIDVNTDHETDVGVRAIADMRVENDAVEEVGSGTVSGEAVVEEKTSLHTLRSNVQKEVSEGSENTIDLEISNNAVVEAQQGNKQVKVNTAASLTSDNNLDISSPIIDTVKKIVSEDTYNEATEDNIQKKEQKIKTDIQTILEVEVGDYKETDVSDVESDGSQDYVEEVEEHILEVVDYTEEVIDTNVVLQGDSEVKQKTKTIFGL